MKLSYIESPPELEVRYACGVAGSLGTIGRPPLYRPTALPPLWINPSIQSEVNLRNRQD